MGFYEEYLALPGKGIDDLPDGLLLGPEAIVLNSRFEVGGSGSLSVVRANVGSTALHLVKVIRPEREAVIDFPEGATVTSIVYDAIDSRWFNTPLDDRRGVTAVFPPIDPEHTRTVELPDGARLHVYSQQQTSAEAESMSVAYDDFSTNRSGAKFLDRVAADEPEARQLVLGLGTLMGMSEQSAAILAEQTFSRPAGLQ